MENKYLRHKLQDLSPTLTELIYNKELRDYVENAGKIFDSGITKSNIASINIICSCELYSAASALVTLF